jgi:hypothetical protein
MKRNRVPIILLALACSWSRGGVLAHADVALQIGQNFTGSTFGPDSTALPADGNGAAGPLHFVEFINGRFSVYEKTNGNRVQTMTDLQFWNAAGLSIPSTQTVSDPRVIFDPDSQRWFASMIDLSLNARRQSGNHFLLAVSQSADPTGAWKGARFLADPNGQLFADFPTLGLDANGVYLSGDMFDRSGNAVGPSLVSLSKADLLAAPPNAAGRVSFGTMTYSARGDIMQPAITTGQATTPEMVVSVGDLGLDLQTHNTLFLSPILGSGTATASLASTAVTLNVPAYTVPIDPPQPDGSNNLDDGDARFSASIRRVGDVVYATHAVEVNNRAAVRWYRINASTSTLIDSGTITDPNLDLFYPSIAANDAGTVVIGCNGSSSSTYISSYAVVGQVVNGTLTFGSLTLLQAGSASYQQPDYTGTSRWGDYSATTVDPADPNRFWTIQLVAADQTTWTTQITELITASAALPQLAVTAANGQVVVSWPASSGSYQLQTSTGLGAAANWTTVTQSATVENNLNSVVLTPSGNVAFFRLVSSSSSSSQPPN